MNSTKRCGYCLVLIPLAVVFALLLPRSAFALRCHGDLVTEGDRAFQVRDACGAPDHVTPLYGGGRYGVEPDVELWYYNFGSNRLMRELRFRDGRLQRIRTSDRGFRPPEHPEQCRPTDITTGMTAYELVARCGEPVQRETRGVRRVPYSGNRGHGYRRAWVEDWYYRFGEQYFDRRVRVADGRVLSVDTLD